MRPGDFIAVSRGEAELLTSDRFKEVASDELAVKILINAAKDDPTYYLLALPKIGARVADALKSFAAGDIDPNEALVAESLADAIAQRSSLT